MFFSGGGFPHVFMSGGGGGIPFGFPDGMGGMPDDDVSDAEVDNTTFYEVLGVEKDASQNEIKKAYMKRCMRGEYAHPDKGGTPEKFQQLQRAYEVLSDPDKRSRYDRGGEQHADQDDSMGDAADIFSVLFGGGRRARGPRKAEPVEQVLTISLEDVYKGKTSRVTVTRSIIKSDPDGSYMDRQGRRYKKTTEREELEVFVEPGVPDGHRIVFEGKGDISPGAEQGDVVIVVQVAKHSLFERKGCDLMMDKTISLYEALAGTRFAVPHLGGRQVIVTTPPGKVISPGEILQVEDEGLRVPGYTHIRGALFIKFNVEFPKTLELQDASRKTLGTVLKHTPTKIKVQADSSEKELEPADMQARARRERLVRETQDDDDDGIPMGGPVQCASQ